MKKVYIAGPMSGVPNYNRENFCAVEKAMELLGHEPFNPIHHEGSKRAQAGTTSGTEAYRECLGIDLDWICKNADAIYMMRGWEKSYGCKAEHATAVALGLEIWYE